jgi:hypothetical protein
MLRSRSIAAALCVCAAVEPNVRAATVQHAEPLRAYRFGDAAKPSAGEPAIVTFNAFSRDFRLELEPNARLERALAQSGDAAGAYRGRVAGRAGSWVRLVLTPAGPSGLLYDGDTLYGIDSVDDARAPGRRGEPSMFRLADVYFAPGELGSDDDAVAVVGTDAVAALTHEVAALAAAGATLRLDLGAVADFEFSHRFGANAESALLARLNNVDGIFSEQLGIEVAVAAVDIFTTSNDPFTASAPSELLDELARYRGATPRQDAQGLTHLFTGRNLDGSTAGIAFFGTVCSRRTRFDPRSFGAGLTEARSNAVVDSLVAAHEIGHNFGAPHDGAAGGACETTPTTFLMAPSINGSNQFSPCSIRQIEAEVAGAACLTPIGAADMALEATAPGTVFAGVSFNQVLGARNDGAETAEGATLTVTTAPGLTIEAAAVGATACSAAPNSATCTLGTVAAGGARQITLTLRAATVGRFALAAAVAADDDADAGNDAVSIDVVAEPLVDLVLSGTSAGVQLNAQATIAAGIANVSDFGATSVVVTATATAGLRIDEATLGGAACTVTGQALSCPPQTLTARASLPLAVVATGVATASEQLTITVTSSEAESTPANNQLAVAVAVSAPVASSGGGGALPAWIAIVLSAFAALRGAPLAKRRRPS